MPGYPVALPTSPGVNSRDIVFPSGYTGSTGLITANLTCAPAAQVSVSWTVVPGAAVPSPWAGYWAGTATSSDNSCYSGPVTVLITDVGFSSIDETTYTPPPDHGTYGPHYASVSGTMAMGTDLTGFTMTLSGDGNTITTAYTPCHQTAMVTRTPPLALTVAPGDATGPVIETLSWVAPAATSCTLSIAPFSLPAPPTFTSYTSIVSATGSVPVTIQNSCMASVATLDCGGGGSATPVIFNVNNGC